MPFLLYIQYRASPLLHLSGNISHEVLRNIYEDLLHRLKEYPFALTHCTIYGVPHGRYDLCRPPVYAVLMQLRIHQSNFNAHELLCRERTCVAYLLERLNAQLHCLVKVLNSLCGIYEHVVSPYRLDILRLIPAHSELLELFCQSLCVLYLSSALHIPLMYGIDHRFLQGLNFDVEPVVLVRGLSFKRPSFVVYALPVNHYWRRCLDLNAVLVLYPVYCHFKMEFTHAGHQVLSGLLIYLNLNGWVLLCDGPENFH